MELNGSEYCVSKDLSHGFVIVHSDSSSLFRCSKTDQTIHLVSGICAVKEG